jgi:hypothetical protein
MSAIRPFTQCIVVAIALLAVAPPGVHLAFSCERFCILLPVRCSIFTA